MKVAIVEGSAAEILEVLKRWSIPAIRIQPDQPYIPPAEDILKAAEIVTGISREQMISESRNREQSYARHLAMYLLHVDGKLALYEIRKIFRRDHSSIHHAIKRIEFEQRTRPETALDVEKCRERMKPDADSSSEIGPGDRD